jgi:hypothetical protein
MFDNIFIFKSEHVDFPNDIYVTLRCDKSKEYLENFPCTGRVVTKDDPEFYVEYIDKYMVRSRKSGWILFTFEINDLYHSYNPRVKDNQITEEIEFAKIFIYRPIVSELLDFNDLMETPYQKIYIEGIG